MQLRRHISEKLLQWKQSSQGRTCLLVEGARRVGKSYSVEAFAKENYKSHIVVDFSNPPKAVIPLFEDFGNDLDRFFVRLSVIYGTKLYKRESVIIFDEIQRYPHAREMMKHFVAYGAYDFIETGSLLSIKENCRDIVIPSEEEKIEMFPLSFEEFLWAMGDDVSFDFIKSCYQAKKPLGQSLHHMMMSKFREYMLVGGMPQAVLSYAATKDFDEVDNIKRNILHLYREDCAKFAGAYRAKVRGIFDEIPGQLSKHEKKFRLSDLTAEARFRDYDNAFFWLSDAMVANICFNMSDPQIGFSLHRDSNTLKCYFVDTGLLFSLAFDENGKVPNSVYKQILFEKLSLNEGMFFENVVSQLLRSAGHLLFFYSRYDMQDRKNTMEIDFLLSRGNPMDAKVFPIEVQSGKYYTHSSLDKFNAKFHARIGENIIIHTKDLKEEGLTLFLPVYMTELL